MKIDNCILDNMVEGMEKMLQKPELQEDGTIVFKEGPQDPVPVEKLGAINTS